VCVCVDVVDKCFFSGSMESHIPFPLADLFLEEKKRKEGNNY
jgi:hypothetical protein